jgi:hypothetical protein
MAHREASTGVESVHFPATHLDWTPPLHRFQDGL